MRAVRVLLVDDDELIRQSVGPMLQALGHEAHTAESGQEALDRVAAGLDPDLVILDMNMPGLNGAQTLARLLELRPGLPVLMATGYSDDAITPLLDGRSNVSCLSKPFNLQELRAKLEAMRGLAEAPARPPGGGA
jgi:CheY-like chemotaxis protein